jgi:hypothetical protein
LLSATGRGLAGENAKEGRTKEERTVEYRMSNRRMLKEKEQRTAE